VASKLTKEAAQRILNKRPHPNDGRSFCRKLARKIGEEEGISFYQVIAIWRRKSWNELSFGE